MNDISTRLKELVSRSGSQKAFADALGISQQGVSYLLNDAKRVSAELAVAIDKHSNGEISKAELRPDLFGDAA
jgi:DNA-binding transcriptional regulator YdaS (Cro superfamily)